MSSLLILFLLEWVVAFWYGHLLKWNTHSENDIDRSLRTPCCCNCKISIILCPFHLLISGGVQVQFAFQLPQVRNLSLGLCCLMKGVQDRWISEAPTSSLPARAIGKENFLYCDLKCAWICLPSSLPCSWWGENLAHGCLDWQTGESLCWPGYVWIPCKEDG